MRASKLYGWILLLMGLVMLLSCATVKEKLGMAETVASTSQSAVKSTKALRSSFKELTEEEEYYIGRSVAALILSRYKEYQNNALTSYVNLVGNAVAAYSERPEIYAGYHFMILDSSEINALAAPGGFVFITKGLLKTCENEEMLGCILAHEVGHISSKHGLKAIKKSRLIDAFRSMGQHLSAKYGPQQLAELTRIFENVLADITEQLIERGYDRKLEYEADKLGVKTAAYTGYNPNGMVGFLGRMAADQGDESGKGWFKTHPSAQDRLKRVQKEIGKIKNAPNTQTVRSNRFKQALRGVK